MKKLAMTVLATAMLTGSGTAMANGGAAGLAAEALLGNLFSNAGISPAIVPAGFSGFYGPPADYARPPYDGRYRHRHHRHWRPYYHGYYGDSDDRRWRRREWREHEWREHEWREHEWREHHWHDDDDWD